VAVHDGTTAGYGASLSGETDAARALAIALRDLDIVQRRIRRSFAARIGLSLVEFNAVMLVAEVGELTPKTLATELSLTPGAVTAMVDRLESADLLRRLRHPTDRRSLLLALGPAGQTAKRQVYSDYSAAVAEAVSRHDELDDPRVAEALTLIANDLTALAPEAAPQ
jgi:DNA-binding MarR family transcriptional regulator